MSRMFSVDGKPMTTWNVFVGCRFRCFYCNARKAAETRFRHIPRYRDGFTPKLVEEELNRKFKPGEFVFVSYMGDIAWAPQPWVETIMKRVRQFPETNFLIQSKDTKRFWDWGITLPPNVYLGTTIETNRDYHLTLAPPPEDRFRFLAGYPHNHKFLSIEPICDFDLEVLSHWVELLQPDIVEVGADNYHNYLEEPGWWKVEELLKALPHLCPKVVEKDGLGRLKGGS